MQTLFSSMPAVYLCVLFMVLCIAGALTGLTIFKKVFNYTPLQKNKEVLANIFATICLLYSLILAFVIVAVWEDYEEVNSIIIQETAKLEDIRIQAQELPTVYTQTIDSAVTIYVHRELKNISQNDNRLVYNRHILQLKFSLYKLDAIAGINAKVVDAIDADISEIINLRHERSSHTKAHIPNLVWLVLIVGSVIVLFFCYMFLAGIGWDEYLYLILLSGMLSMCLFLVYALDHPFYGTSGVSLDPFRQILGIE